MYSFHHINTRRKVISLVYFFLLSINRTQVHEFLMSRGNLGSKYSTVGVRWKNYMKRIFNDKMKAFSFTSLQRKEPSRHIFFVMSVGRYIINIFDMEEKAA